MKPDFLDLLRTLDRHHVEHVIVGGVAAILEGAPVTTLDLDVVYRTSEENLHRLASALDELEALYRDPAGRRIAPTVERLRTNRTNLFVTRIGLLDALQTIGDDLGYEDLEDRTAVREVGGLEVRVLGLAAVIATKEVADRDKDRAMLPVLRRTLELKSAVD